MRGTPPRLPFLLGLLLAGLLIATPIAAMAPLASVDAAAVQGSDVELLRSQSGASYRVFATREGLVGEYTSNGHIITPGITSYRCQPVRRRAAQALRPAEPG